ncbi:MAG: DUF4252 domain-containing protein [Flavobacteriales bacterium]|nr:DUF4252 domain-containing protein [Flavobacteriales bacterium]
MSNRGRKSHLLLAILLLTFVGSSFAKEINDFYSRHKNDIGMEAKIVPPKMASMFVDEDYPEAIDILKSLNSLKYLNFWGDQKSIQKYAVEARAHSGAHESLLEVDDKVRKVHVFGTKKRGKVKKIMAVVESKSQFLLIIAKGKLSQNQIAHIPTLAKEIQ